MKNPELFHKTVGILVAAFINNTLNAGEPCGCAVGNIIAANNDIKVTGNGTCWETEKDLFKLPYWNEIHNIGEFTSRDWGYNPENGLKQIATTGYDKFQTCAIERAFEYQTGYEDLSDTDEDYIFYGLMAVVDVLMDIHEATAEEVKQAKELFTLTA